VLLQQLYFTRYVFELYSNFTFFKDDRINGDQIRQKEQRDLAGYAATYTTHYTQGKLNVQAKGECSSGRMPSMP
jgi:hypothetical protein